MHFEVKEYTENISKIIPGYKSIYEMTFAYLSSNIKSNAEILVVGSGGGAEIQYMANIHNDWHITGIDPSQEMCNNAQSVVDSLELSARVEIVNGYVSNLPREKYFSAATSILVMHLLEDNGAKFEYLSNILYRLESGAPFILVDFCGDRTAPLFFNQIAAWKRNAQNRGVTPEMMQKQERVILEELPFVTENREIALLNAVGFSKITSFYQSFMYKGWIAHK